MFNALLFIHLVIATLLVITILLQKTSSDGLSGIGGSSGGMGLISKRTVSSFLTKTTVILTILFFINAIVLANLSSRPNIEFEMEANEAVKVQDNLVPIAN